jgi:hypothetical protein
MRRASFCLIAIVALVAPVAAQMPAPVAATQSTATATAPARRILFIGNSFTFGAYSAVRGYRADSVSDLNGEGIGGVPALFKRFTEQAGLSYAVSLETSPGKGLDFHLAQKRAVIDRPWDVVILQGHSVLDPARPGDPAVHVRAAAQLADLLAARNPAVELLLSSTWSRADKVYQPGSPWSGTPIAQMATDVRRANDMARTAAPRIAGVIPVGEGWNRAIAEGIADANPYDGIGPGQVDLWAYDHYHASSHGYYLEALLIFGRVTARDPRSLGAAERAAFDLGIAPETARALQDVAFATLADETRLGRSPGR